MKRPAAATSVKASVHKSWKGPASASPCGSADAMLDEPTWLTICSHLSGRYEGCALSFLSKTWKARVEVLPQFVSVLLVSPAMLIKMDDISDSDPEQSEFYGDLGRVEDLKHTQMINAKICVCNKLVGQCDLVLIDFRRPLNFHEACDAPSADLQSVGVQFCNRHGFPRIASVKAALEGQARRGFLYIDDFVLHKCETESDSIRAEIGAHALRSLLQGTALSGRWHLAVYIPNGLVQMSETRCMQDWRTRSRWEAARKLGPQEIVSLEELDARQFLQAGFKQAKELVMSNDCYHFFATPDCLNEAVMSFNKAVNLPIMRRPLVWNPAGELNAQDGTLFNAVQGAMQGSALTKAVKSQIRCLVSEGAAIEASRVVHCCAAHLHADCFEFLLGSYAPSVTSAINVQDHHGMTPLMCAASRALDTSKFISFCTRLVGLGADVNIQDLSGRTALGILRAARERDKDFRNTFGIGSPDEQPLQELQSLERLLMPSEGPTMADQGFSDSESDSLVEDVFDESSEDEEL